MRITNTLTIKDLIISKIKNRKSDKKTDLEMRAANILIIKRFIIPKIGN